VDERAPRYRYEGVDPHVADRLKARRTSAPHSKLILVLIGVVLALLAVIVVVLAQSPLFREPTANEIARDEVLAALDANPGDADLLMSLAEIEYELGRKGDALGHAEQAVANGGEIVGINMRYAMLLLRERQVDEAKVALEAEITLDPTVAEPHFLMAQVLREQGDLEGAIAEAETALDINPIDGDYRMLYAQVLALAGRTDEAIAAYRSALAVLPGDERGIQGLSELGVTYDSSETTSPHQ
jgi:tetratricopeptide (TPR) repeat protein